MFKNIYHSFTHIKNDTSFSTFQIVSFAFAWALTFYLTEYFFYNLCWSHRHGFTLYRSLEIVWISTFSTFPFAITVLYYQLTKHGSFIEDVEVVVDSNVESKETDEERRDREKVWENLSIREDW